MHARAMPGAEKDAQSHLRIDASILLCMGPVLRSSVPLCERFRLEDTYPSPTWKLEWDPLIKDVHASHLKVK